MSQGVASLRSGLDDLMEHKATWESVETQHALREHKTKMVTLIKSVLNTNLDNIMVNGDFEESRQVGEIMLRSFVLKTERGIVLPGILLESKAKSSNQDVILYINENGKSDILKDMDIVKDILREGY